MQQVLSVQKWLPPAYKDKIAGEGEAMLENLLDLSERLSKDGRDHVLVLVYIRAIEVYGELQHFLPSKVRAHLVKSCLGLLLKKQLPMLLLIRLCRVTSGLLSKFTLTFTPDLFDELEIPWRPLYEMLMEAHFPKSRAPRGCGANLESQYRSNIVNLVRRSRKFFPPSSATEIIAEMRPMYLNRESKDAFTGAALLALFLPTPAPDAAAPPASSPPLGPARLQAYPSECIEEWLTAWGALSHYPLWDMFWAVIICRAGKGGGDFDWSPHIPFLFARLLNALRLPGPLERGGHSNGGNATGTPPSSAKRLWVRKDCSNTLMDRMGKIVVMLIGVQRWSSSSSSSDPNNGNGTPNDPNPTTTANEEEEEDEEEGLDGWTRGGGTASPAPPPPPSCVTWCCCWARFRPLSTPPTRAPGPATPPFSWAPSHALWHGGRQKRRC